MPKGVEHADLNGFNASEIEPPILPLMPKGVEHRDFGTAIKHPVANRFFL